MELHQRPHAARGALLQFEWLSKTRGPRPSAAGAEGLAEMDELRPLLPGGPGGANPLLFTTRKPCQNVQEENRSCARDQVVVARPHVLTPPHGFIGALL